MRVEEMFNFTFEPVHIPGGEFLERLGTAHLAGEAYVDIFYVGANQTLNAFNRGYILAVSDLSPPDADWRNAQLYAWPGVTIDGHVLGITRPLPVMNQPGIFVNLDLINALGLPNPAELLARGEWTWDAMREIMAAGTTGNYYGVSGLLGNAMMHLIVANDGHIVDPNTLSIGHDSPAALAAIELIQEIIDNGWFMIGDRGIDNYFTAGGANNHIFMYGRSVLHFTGSATNFTAARNAGGGVFPMNFDFVPYPMGPNNTSGATFQNNGRNNEGIVAGTEVDPEILMWILEELKKFTGEDYYREHEADHD
jgi:ABC-type glycerol-3-phosphate transport system substrate-binding protein